MKSFKFHLIRQAKALSAIYRSLRPVLKRKCSVCKFYGWFIAYGSPPRLDAMCPNCKSLERHRLLSLAFSKNLIPGISTSTKVLHFAPEPSLEKIFRQYFTMYQTADLADGKAELKINLEDINLPQESYDLIIANHVLEHVDDFKASSELMRILRKKGLLVCMVPLIEGWSKTYEDQSVRTDQERRIHFGQSDHLRFYGADFRQRISRCGLKLIQEITAEGYEVIEHSLFRGEKVFIFEKE